MTNMEASEIEVASAEEINVSHEPGHVKFQVNLTKPHIDDTYLGVSDQHKIAATLSARADVTNAYVGPDNYLHVIYNPKGLSGEKRDRFIEELKGKVADAIEHKLRRIRLQQLGFIEADS